MGCKSDALSSAFSVSVAGAELSGFLGEDGVGGMVSMIGSSPLLSVSSFFAFRNALRMLDPDPDGVCPLFPATRKPIPPDREGPIIVVVYFSPVAPGNPVGLPPTRPEGPWPSSSLGG